MGSDEIHATLPFMKIFTSNVVDPSHIEIPSAEASALPTEGHASAADEN